MEKVRNRHIARAIEHAGGSQNDLAALLGCGQQFVSRLLNNTRKITPKMAKRLHEATDGKVAKWDTCPEIFDPPEAERAA